MEAEAVTCGASAAAYGVRPGQHARTAIARRIAEPVRFVSIFVLRRSKQASLSWVLLAACVMLGCAGYPLPHWTSTTSTIVPEVAPPDTPAPPPPLDPGTLPCTAVHSIEVRKHDRFLEAWCEGGGRRRFPIALSREPVGGKSRRGDQRIPEGDYRIAGSARPSRYYLFIPIDYPSPRDAELGLEQKVISPAVHRAILAAHAARRLPPQDTALGGWVGFHGEGERWRGDLDLDWTNGCIALSDEAMRWLNEHAHRGVPVKILP